MLQRIRDNSQSFVSKIIIGLIIGVFALFGAESIVGGFFGTNSVATVNGEEISEQELNNSVQNLMANIGGAVADMDDELLRQIALEQLIEDRLLMQAAADAGLRISDRSIDRQILQSPQFQLDGTFNRDMAVRTMASQGFTPATYRDALAERMVISQLANGYASSAFVTDAELERIAQLQAQRRDFRYVSVTPGTRTLGEPISDADITAYYENNSQRFMREEQVSVDYVVLDRDAIFAAQDVDPDRVRAQYEQEREAATASVERRVSHILLEVGQAVSEEQAMATASELRARIMDGEDFAELAAEYSDDVASGADGGDIGYTDGTVFPDALENALLDLEVGEVSDPVRSEFGVHLVQLTEYEAQDYPEFEEVAERIERDLVAADVERDYFGRREEMANLAFESFDLEPIAEMLDLEIRQSAFFGRNGGNDQITSNSAVYNAAFSDDVLVDDLNSDLIELSDDRAVVIHLREHRRAELRPLDEVRAEIAALLRSERERQLARELGERLLETLRSGESVDELLDEHELQWREHESASRQDPAINPEVLQAAFSVQPGQDDGPVYRGSSLRNGAFVVIELQSVEQGSLADMSDEERRQFRSQLLEQSGRRTFDALLDNRRQEASIR